ncbi:MAG TPA: S53 family peptidase [Gaiellales bacterium]|nr:S53 family peptidase [Gaiellales bacterium]
MGSRRVGALVGGLIVALATTAALLAGQAQATVEHYAHHPFRVHGNTTLAPSGLSPAQVQSAYAFPTDQSGGGQTIAIVDAYNDPTIASDLSTFDSQYGLPTCTSANGCFKKVNQTGGSSYPRNNSGWALEISLDVEWAHAIAPGAHILLVEAKTNSFTNLMAAEDYAKNHAQYVSNSWGGNEFSGEASYDGHFSAPGVSFFASSGDTGGAVEYPSSSPNVISVGGTTLHFDSTGGFSGETAWSSGGGGCSAYETATAAQQSASTTLCGTRRGTPDVSLDADPASGVSVYDSTTYQSQSGWWQVGGTSASTPMWAARSADAGAVVDAGYVYANPANIAFRDITSGSNGYPAATGFDLATGLGSWTG